MSAKFTFDYCLNKESKDLLFGTKKCSKVVFDRATYGEDDKTLEFKEPRTIQYIVNFVEKYLSQPLTKNYYKKHGHNSYEDYNGLLRGDLLCDTKVITDLSIDEDNALIIVCENIYVPPSCDTE